MPLHQDFTFKRGRAAAALLKHPQTSTSAVSTLGTVYTDISIVEHAKIATPGFFGKRECWQMTESNLIFPEK